MYLWTTFGLTSALEKIWKSQQPTIQKRIASSPYIIEVTTMLERALAMAYTGDARVITSRLMKPFGLERSLIEHGLPSITAALTFDLSIAKDMVVNPANWPSNKNQEPAMASKRSQVLTCGDAHFMVSVTVSTCCPCVSCFLVGQKYFACFKIMCCLSVIPPHLFPDADMAIRPSLVVAHLALNFYVDDITKLVRDAVTSHITELEDSGDQVDQQQAKIRKRDLKTWRQQDNPFSYDSYISLCHIICPDKTSLPLASDRRLILKDFLHSLIIMTKQPSTNKAPFIKGGSFQHVLPVAIQKIEELADIARMDVESTVLHCLLQAWKPLKLHTIPWSPPHRPNAVGAPQSLVVYNAWVTFSAITVDPSLPSL